MTRIDFYRDNHVADFRTTMISCEKCQGTGNLQMSKDEFRNFLHHEVTSFREGLAHYRQWKKTGEVFCFFCNGEGTWEVNF